MAFDGLWAAALVAEKGNKRKQGTQKMREGIKKIV